MESRLAGALRLAAALSCVALIHPTAARALDAELAAVQSELTATQRELAETKAVLNKVVRRLDELEASAPGTPATIAEGAPRLPPVNADNPAISFVVDTTLAAQGSDPGWNFALRSGELFLSAPIDPFLRGYASINGTSEEFDLEEAALVTTALPYNLTVKGGRFFADVGRFPHWHDEALPFVDRPPSIDRLFGGETSAEGLEVTWLAPIDHFVQVTAGLYNAIGAENREDLVENGFDGRRAFDELTWLVRPKTYFDLTGTLNLEVGGTYFTVAQNGIRNLFGADVVLRHQPGTSAFYQGLVAGSEWYWNKERFEDLELGEEPDTGETLFGDGRFSRNGGYAYVEGFFGRRFSAGLRGDVSEAISGDADSLRTYSAFVTWMPSEFQRLRLQGDLFDQKDRNDQRITLQWTAFIGSHSHGFATR